MNLSELQSQNPHWLGKPITNYPYHRQLFHSIWSRIDLNPIVYLTGQRRVGKSVIVKQLIQHLIIHKLVPPQQILFFEFSPRSKKDDLGNLTETFLNEIANKTQPAYLVFDEIQFVDHYESQIKLLYDNLFNTKIILTGSLSLSYKRKMEESLAGRFLPYKLLPLNFEEYLQLSQSPLSTLFHQNPATHLLRAGLADQLNPTFRKFLTSGRFPESVNFPNPELTSYSKTIIDQTVNQDAMQYFRFSFPNALRDLLNYYIQNNGSEISYHSLANQIQLNIETVSKYTDILELMGMIYIIKNSDNPLRSSMTTKKVYVNSQFYSLLSGKNEIQTLGYSVESYILERLLEQNHFVTFYRQRQNEIDFLLPEKKIAYEVKFRHNLETPKYLLNFCQHQHFQPHLITLNQTLATPPLAFTPACLF